MLRRNILLFHAGALGDFVLTWPLGLALGRLFTQSRIIYVTQSEKGKLAERALKLDSIDVESGWHHLFGNPAQLPATCRDRLLGAQLIFTFVAKLDDPWTNSVAQIAPEAQIISVPAPKTEAHASRRLLDAVADRPAISGALEQMLRSIESRGIGFSTSGANRVLIHPGGGSPEKCWPLDRFCQLAAELKRRDKLPVFILGEVERERWSQSDHRKLRSLAEVISPVNYCELFEDLRSADHFIGNDSGPGHLAAIMGVPSLILFGPSDPVVWRPLGPHVEVLRRQPLAELSVDEVLSRLTAQL